MKIALDTNVILDVVEKREPYFTDSYRVFLKSAAGEFEAIIGGCSYSGDSLTGRGQLYNYQKHW